MKKWEGICRGGPYDNQLLAGHHPVMVVATHAVPPLKVTQYYDPSKPPEIKYGQYRYILGQWIWRDKCP